MIKTGHLGKYEVFGVIVIGAMADMFLSFPQQFVLLGASAGWMIPFISMIICLGVWAVIGPVLVKQTEGDFLSFIRRYIGRIGTIIVIFSFVALLLIDSASTMRIFTETVVVTVLPRTPIAFVAIPFVLVLVYYAYSGIEGISRVAWLLIPWLLTGIAALLLLDSNWMNWEYIMPFWGRGIPVLLISGFIFTGIFKNIMFLAILSSMLRNKRDTVKIGYWSILTVGLTYTFVTLGFLMAFPPEASMRSTFPLYQLARLIYVGRFVQRLEAAFVFIWAAMIVIKLALKLWLLTYLFAGLLKMPVNRPLVFPMALIVYSLSFIPKGFAEMLIINTHFLLRWKWTVDIAVPLLALLWVRFRAKKGGTQNEKTQTS